MPESRTSTHVLDETTVARLVELVPGSAPFASVYVDLDPGHFPTPDTRESEIAALVAKAARADGIPEDVLARLHDELVAASESARGLAGFAAADGTVEVVALRRDVLPDAREGALPHLLPLTAPASSGRWCAALVTRRSGRLLVGDEFELREVERISDEVHKRHSGGGWAALEQSRFQRSMERDVDEHYKRVAGALVRLHRRSGFEHLLLACPKATLAPLRDALGHDLRGLLDGAVRIDAERAAPAEVVDRARGIIANHEERMERSWIERLEEEAGGGRAAFGVDEVLTALAMDRVATLVVAEDLDVGAWTCAQCDWRTAAPLACPVHGPTERCDAADAAIVTAVRRGVDVTVVRHRRADLLARGGIAAVLRY